MFNSNASSATAGEIVYIEDVFSTWLYTGTGVAQTITNGVNLSTKGGLVWCKDRNSGVMGHHLVDTVRGASKDLQSQSANGETTVSTVTAFTTSGFTLGTSTDVNTASILYTSWAFCEQSRFFDAVTYTGTGANRTIAHSLGSVPGCIIVKRTDTTGDWQVYHNSLANTQYTVLNTTAAVATGATRWNSTTPTDAVFSLGTDATVNASGGSYVAYIFASNAGGFGLTGADNVISCGSYTGNGSTTGPTVTLGYEPQWIIVKNSAGGSWRMFDVMRGMPVNTGGNSLNANTAAVEVANDPAPIPTATGFRLATTDTSLNGNGNTILYIAIRRGPMKVPTDGTKVFLPQTRTGTGTAATVSGVGFPPDFVISNRRSAPSGLLWDRLRGVNTNVNPVINTTAIGAETPTDTNGVQSFTMDGMTLNTNWSGENATGAPIIDWFMRRAAGFFDEVCYTGNNVLRTINHNLGVAPEMIFIKCRDSAVDWAVYHAGIGNTKYAVLNSTAASATSSSYWNNTSPTASVFTVNTASAVNSTSLLYVAYLFATCPGVSKVGSYTGTGTTQQINCGFTAGSRYVFIKRTDSTGDWYVWDSARGIIPSNDPYLLLNSTDPEVTGTDYVDTISTGFEITSTAPAAINASGGTYIFLAIA
jgi:hypothetical protein